MEKQRMEPFGSEDIKKALNGMEVKEVLGDIIAPNILEGMDTVITEEVETLRQYLKADEYKYLVEMVKEGVEHILENILETLEEMEQARADYWYDLGRRQE